MGPMMYTRLDERLLTDEVVLAGYSGGFTDGGKEMLEALRIARRWNITLEEFNEWMDQPTDDYANLYFHNLFCDCGRGYHYDNILWSMGAMGTAHGERKRARGSDWPGHQKVSK